MAAKNPLKISITALGRNLSAATHLLAAKGDSLYPAVLPIKPASNDVSRALTGAVASALAGTLTPVGGDVPAISIGVHAANMAGATTVTTPARATTTGSTIVIGVTWYDTPTFTSVTDSVGLGAPTQIQSEIVTGLEKSRMYYYTNITGNAAHTFTLTISATAACEIFMVELLPQSGYTISLDQSDRRTDTASPFTLAAGLASAITNEALINFFVGDSGSNPATMDETGITDSTILEQYTNGTSQVAAALTAQIVQSVATYSPSWTQSGATNGTPWMVLFRADAGGVTRALTSALATASAGTLVAAITNALTGAEATAFGGSLTTNEAITVALTGAFATAQAGSLVSSVAQPLTSALGTTNTGNMASGMTVPLTSALGTANTGMLVAAITQALSGSAGTAGAGTVSPVGGDSGPSSQPLTGAQATASAGTMVPQISMPLTGDGLLAEAGTLRSAIAQPLITALATSAAGTLAGSADYVRALTSALATAQAGTLGPAITQPLTGAAASGQAGTLISSADYVRVLTGSEAVSSAGSVGVAVTGVLGGSGVVAQTGNVTPVGGDTGPVVEGGSWLLLSKRRGSR